MKYSSLGPALLAAGLLFCTLFAPFGAYADNKKDELSAKQNQAQQAYNKAQQELEELQNQQSETQSQIDQLQGQSAEVAAQLSGIYTALQEAQRTLDERTAAAEQAAQALADKQAEYDASLARYKSQMGAMQLLDGGGSITLLMQARSLYEILTFAETLRELADHNSAALAQLNAEAEALDTARAEAQAAADEAEAARAAEAAAGAAHEQDLSERLTPEQRAFVARGRDYVRQMDELNAAIDDAAVSERITAIQDVMGRILARAEEEPAVIAGLDRLTAYYLPTTVKLLDAYDRLEEEPIQGENISSSRSEIEHTLEVLHSAFEKLFDDTYQDLSLDVSADISVLHAMLAQEGLTEGPFDVKP